MITIGGAYTTPEGDNASGTVTFTPSGWTADGPNIITAHPIVRTLADGAVMAELVRPCDTDLPGWCWRVIERIDGQPTRVWWLDLDAHEDGTALDLSDVAPDPAAPDLARTPGPTGDTGPQGPQGETGPTGPGVPPGGTIGQLLTKTGNGDYATGWVDDPAPELTRTIGTVAAEVMAVDQRVTDTNAVLSALAAMHPVGDGSPLGRITPGFVGQQYVDRQATCGASVWVATGLTAQSWTVLHGDTGWRDITSLLTPGAGWSGLTVKARRTQAGIWWRASATAATGASVTVATGLPSGWFQTDAAVQPVLTGRHGGGGHTSLLVSAGGVLANLSPVQVTSHAWQGLCQAVAAWPTVLPGTATATAFALDDDA